VLDMSRSMLAQDVLPSRFERAKAALRELSEAFQARGGNRLALVGFAGHSKVYCPLTHDYEFFRATLGELDAANLPPELQPAAGQPGSGTRIGAALCAAVELQDSRAAGYHDILLLSDGDDPARDDEWRSGVLAAQAKGIRVYTIGIGNPDIGSPIPALHNQVMRRGGKPVLTRLEEEPLELIAKATGATYTPSQTGPLSLVRLLHEHIESSPVREDLFEPVQGLCQRYGWFYAAGLAFLGLFAILGFSASKEATQLENVSSSPNRLSVRSNRLILGMMVLLSIAAVSLPGPEAQIREGNQEFAAGNFQSALDDYGAAEERCIDPGMVAYDKAAALYAQGRYREAEVQYRCCAEDAVGLRRSHVLYGLANCLVLEGNGQDPERLRKAVRRYEECLGSSALSAELSDDAGHNLELARILLANANIRGSTREHQEPEADADQPQRQDSMEEQRRERSETGHPADASEFNQPSSDREDLQKMEAGDKKSHPGKGDLPTLPDQDTLAPLTRDDALNHLQEARTRIDQERQEFRKTFAHPAPELPLNW
jgi:Ca-activated chloride channel family protein